MKKEMVTLGGVSKKIDSLSAIANNLVLTVDNLAIATKRGFDETAKRADVDKKFEEVDKRFDKIDERLDQIEGFVGGHGRRIDNIVDDLRVVKTKVGIR